MQRIEQQIARYGGGCPADFCRNARLQPTHGRDGPHGDTRRHLPRGPSLGWRRIPEDSGHGDFGISVKIEKRGAQLHFDFTGTNGQARGPVNAPFAVTASVCYYTILALAGGSVPPNSGAYRVVRITAPEGTLVNPIYPAPVVAANTETSNRIVDVLLDALAPAMPERAVAGSYGCAGVFALGGVDPASGRRFVHMETIGGGMGASAQGPGIDGHRVHMGNTMESPCESAEAALPLRIETYALVDGSGGAGIHAGGMGTRKVIRSLVDDVEFSLLYERALNPAQGAADGAPGQAAAFAIEHADGSRTPLFENACRQADEERIAVDRDGRWRRRGRPSD